MTVLDKAREDIRNAPIVVIVELGEAPCAICDQVTYLRYGCCFGCAGKTDIADPRLVGYPRVGGKPT